MKSLNRRQQGPALIVFLVCLSGCAAAAPLAIPVVMSMGRSLLQAVTKNYGGGYSQDVDLLIKALIATADRAARERYHLPPAAGYPVGYGAGYPGTVPQPGYPTGGTYGSAPPQPGYGGYGSGQPSGTQPGYPSGDYPVGYPGAAPQPGYPTGETYGGAPPQPGYGGADAGYPSGTQPGYPSGGGAGYPGTAPQPGYPPGGTYGGAPSQPGYGGADAGYPSGTQPGYPSGGGAGYPGTAPQPGYPPGGYPTGEPSGTYGSPPPQPGYGGADAGYPSGTQPGYGSTADYAYRGAVEPPPLSLNISLMKKTPTGAVPIDNGAELHDGRGDPMAGDQLRVFFSPSANSYVYVIAIDATGWVQPLFPSQFPDRMNPAQAGKTYLLPDASHWYGLDQYRGVQHIYFLASHRRRDDIEKLLARFAGQERPALEAPVPVNQAEVVEAEVIDRGLTGIRPGSVSVIESDSGESYRVEPTNVRFNVPGADLVVTRWFYHR